jgi:hypothetical protein
MFEFEIKMNKWKQMSADRMEICNKCEHLDKTLYTCNKCGCFMKAKTLLVNSECPIGKWGKATDTPDTVEPPK